MAVENLEGRQPFQAERAESSLVALMFRQLVSELVLLSMREDVKMKLASGNFRSRDFTCTYSFPDSEPLQMLTTKIAVLSMASR